MGPTAGGLLQHCEDSVLRFLTSSGQVQAKRLRERTGAFGRALQRPRDCQALAGAVMPWVLVAQAVKAMAYPTNGALMGALEAWPTHGCQWVTADLSTVLTGASCSHYPSLYLSVHT